LKANSYSSPGRAGGNKEDVASVLTILTPEATPFTNLLPKTSNAKTTFFETGVSDLDKPRTTGTREGDAGTKAENKADKRARFGAYMQRWRRGYGVSDVQQIVSEKGGNYFVSDELAASKATTLRELKRDIEATLCTDRDHKAGGEENMETRGFFSWTSGTLPTTGAGSVPAEFQTPAGMRITGQATLLDLGPNSVGAWLKEAFKVYGMSGEFTGICGVDYKEQIDSTFTGVDPTIASRKYRVDDRGATREVEVFITRLRTSLGVVDFMPSDFLLRDANGDKTAASDKALMILRRDHWHLDSLYPLQVDQEDQDGGGYTGFYKMIAGLYCKSPKGSGFIRN
jgi:hypothetical protein